MRELKFFPSRDIMSVNALKIFQLKELHFEPPRDLTWWEEPVRGERQLTGGLVKK